MSRRRRSDLLEERGGDEGEGEVGEGGWDEGDMLNCDSGDGEASFGGESNLTRRGRC